jgi:hypothetical protein
MGKPVSPSGGAVKANVIRDLQGAMTGDYHGSLFTSNIWITVEGDTASAVSDFQEWKTPGYWRPERITTLSQDLAVRGSWRVRRSV